MSYKVISQLEFDADAINLKDIRNNLRHIFEEFNVEKNIADNMVIAINEACMNIIQHAYGGVEEDSNIKKIIINIEKNNQQWRFELIDFAPPVDISTIKAKDLSEVRPGGLGVSFIQQIMDSVEYANINEHERQGNRLILIKNTSLGNKNGMQS